MKSVKKATSRIAALLLSGMLAIGSVPLATLGTEVDVEAGQSTDVVVEGSGENNSEGDMIEQYYDAAAQEEDAVESYTVTLDANGGYFANEWDDALNETLETAEIVTKLIPIGGTVTTFPVLEQENAVVTFLGWSLEPNGELVSQGYEEYVPVDNCALYAVWQVEEIPVENEETEEQEEEQVEGVADIIPTEDQSDLHSNLGESTDGEFEISGYETNTFGETDNIAEQESEDNNQNDVTRENIDEDGQEETLNTTASTNVVTSGTCGENLTWTLDEEGTLLISGTGDMYDYGYSDNKSPWNAYTLKKVIIDSGVTSIGRFAFRDCNNLSNISIPSSVTSIGSSAFSGCSGLASITIPESVTSIGDFTFSNCSSLTSITIPNGLKKIQHHTFQECSSLLNVSIPGSVEIIDRYAFNNCDNLSSITLSDGLTCIGHSAFQCCSKLSSITIPGSVENIDVCAFAGCSNLTDVIILEGVTNIGINAFQLCSSLTNITIPGSVTNIGDCAFDRCTSLKSITIPESVTSIGDGAFIDCSSLESIIIPENVTSIGEGAFAGCSGLVSIQIPDSVTSLGKKAFRNCNSLTNITIPNGITIIDEYTFSGCTSMTSVSISKNVTSIGSYAFSSCKSLPNIIIPESVTKIDRLAFFNCSSLKIIDIPESVTNIGERVFWLCVGLESVTIPSSIEIMGDSAFEGCSGLKNITFREGTTVIGNCAFVDCTSLASVTIPDSVTSIGDAAFCGCSSLTSISIPDGLTSISPQFLEGCTSLTSVTIPESITSIGRAAFCGCNSLTSITIPLGVTHIGDIAFQDCSNLVIRGYSGTTAHKYAEANHIPFNTLSESVNGASIIVSDQVYSGEALEPDVSVYVNGTLLEKETDYTVEYRNNINAGTGIVTITGRIKYVGTEEKTFIINKDSQSLISSDMFLVYPNSEKIAVSGNQGELFFESSDADIVEVDSTGKVTAKSTGTATITITAAETDNYNEATKEINVNVSKGTQSLTAPDLTLTYPDSGEIKVSGNQGNLKYICSNTDIAEVDSTGIVTAKKVGTATITITAAESDNYNEITKEIIVTVAKGTQPIKAQDLTLKYPNNGNIKVSGNKGKLSYSSSDTSVITVDSSGNVMTKGAGTAKITIKAAETDYYKETEKEINVIVEKGTQWIMASDFSLTYPYDGRLFVYGNVGDISYKSSNTEVAVVDDTGRVYAKKVGTSTITISALETDNYNAATKIITVTINPESIDEVVDIDRLEPLPYTGKEQSPIPSVHISDRILSIGTDFTATYENNINVGTATITITGKGNYTGTKTATFKIEPASITDSSITGLTTKTYTGKTITQTPVVSIGSTNLKEGTDYTVACDNNTNVGTATITITGKGNYTGTKTATFEIEPASITGSSITGLSTKTYTGKAITQTPVVKSGSTTLIEGADYTVSYKNNINPGTATVIITGSGNYTGTKEVAFTINVVGWIQESGEWYYYKNDGTKLTNGWAKDSKGWYWLDAFGKITKSQWIKSGGSWYYLGADGIMTTGWQKDDGKWYYMNSSGIMTTGWQQISGMWYYMNSSGIMTTGWQQIGGKWYYMNSSGIMTTGWQQIGGKWYYMNSSGIMTTGWQQVGGKWYYMNSSGIMTTGWQKVGGNWYYMNSSGIMTTGWQQIGGKWYYMKSSGIMTTGWQVISGKWYYFDASGVWVR